MQDRQFQQLVDKGNPVGEVIGVDSFMVKIRGLQPANTHALVRFEDGSRGYIHHIYEDYVVVMNLSIAQIGVGMVAVIQSDKLLTKVGKNFIGRVVSAFGDPLDGKGPIQPDGVWDVFHNAPMLYERELLDTQLETGITLLDINFSLVRGQRMAILGDSKVGKTSLTTQIAINQKNTDITVIYVLIAKRQRDVAQLVDRLEKNNALDKAIVIVSNMFESLITTYLIPYIAAAQGEYLWQQCGMDTLIIYDDLTSHAQAYREISLISGVSPGRDSYPGDMFYTHSSLVERAGRIERNHAAQTILPIIYAPSGDITAYLPTNVMSMTDGQWVLDMNVFKDTMKPAISTGLSVTRVGGVGQNKRQKALAAQLNKTLAGYHQAEEYAHFGTELSAESQANFDKGKDLFRLMNQDIGEGYSLMDQQFILDIVLNSAPGEKIDIKLLKESVAEYSAKVVEDDKQSNFDALRDELKAKVLMDIKDAKAAKPAAKDTESGDNDGPGTAAAGDQPKPAVEAGAATPDSQPVVSASKQSVPAADRKPAGEKHAGMFHRRAHEKSSHNSEPVVAPANPAASAAEPDTQSVESAK